VHHGGIRNGTEESVWGITGNGVCGDGIFHDDSGATGDGGIPTDGVPAA